MLGLECYLSVLGTISASQPGFNVRTGVILADLPAHLVANPFNGLKKVVADFLQSEIRKIDIWEIEIVCREVSPASL